MDNYQLYLDVQAAVNTQQGGFMRPERNFISWLNDVSNELFNEYADEWQKNRKYGDALAPFLKSVNVVLIPRAGQPHDVMPRPADYGHFSSARIFYPGKGTSGVPADRTDTLKDGECIPWKDEDDKAKELRDQGKDFESILVPLIDNGRWSNVLRHRILGPKVRRPYMTQYDAEFKVAPKGLGIVVLDYLVKPTPATFIYTIGSNDEIIYNQGASQQLQWTDLVKNTIIARIKQRYGSYTGMDTKYQQGVLESKKS